MSRRSLRFRLPLVALLCAAGALRAQESAVAERVSSFGAYEGWSEAHFSAWVTTSQYVEMRDGVRLAVDVTRPAIDGVAVDFPFPVVWTHSRYHRNPQTFAKVLNPGAQVPDGLSFVDIRPDLQRLIRHGYVVAAAGVRGSGASFGRFEGLFSEAETQDAVELIAWFAEQPWCDGNVGMWGGSYLGITQYMAASKNPPALKAIFPDVAAFDMYDTLYPGGVFREDMLRHWDELTDQLDAEWLAPPVDGDEGGELLSAAVAEHADNWQVLDGYRAAPLRDSVGEELDWKSHGPSTHLAAINSARIPCYHYNGWFDVFALDSVLWFANYEGPQRLTIGPWAHAGMPEPSYGVERMRVNSIEQHRWFDRWLKGIENGVDDEDRIQFALHLEPGKWDWLAADSWPPEGVEDVLYSFGAGPSESIASVNDGRLIAGVSADAGSDEYALDPSTTTGTSTRWDNAVGAAPAMAYTQLAANDKKALTYTSAVLEEDLLIAGHPVVTLRVTASAGDADFIVLLEEVDPSGFVHYTTEGVLRGSHRRTSAAPWNNLGLPYQRSHAEDREPLPADEPAVLELDLHPIAARFDAGNRIRVAIFCADADNTEKPPAGAGETIRLFREGSGITLPVMR